LALSVVVVVEVCADATPVINAVPNSAIAIYLDFMMSSGVNRNNTGCSALVPLVGERCARSDDSGRREDSKRNWTERGDVLLLCDAATIRWFKDFAAGWPLQGGGWLRNSRNSNSGLGSF
jgi:hypothetical protein